MARSRGSHLKTTDIFRKERRLTIEYLYETVYNLNE